jgi:putative transposase
MCVVLKIARSSYYYLLNHDPKFKDDQELVEKIKVIFHKSRRNYGTRKIKRELAKENIVVSRRKIGRIMAQEGLVSRYTVAQFKPAQTSCNEVKIANKLNRKFNDKEAREVVVSDLTYVRVDGKWNYICILLDLHNREIIGYSAGTNKTAELVKEAFMKVSGAISAIQLFHTDRGKEFKNQLIDEMLETFDIDRSLSRKGTPYDNAVAEAGFKIIKTEFINGMFFENLDALKIELFDYVNWYNNHRIHSSLGYLTPVQFRNKELQNFVQ